MRSLISALAAAGLLMLTLSCYSADEPYTGQSKAEKPAAPARKSRQSSPSPTPTSPAAPARKSRQSSPSPTRTSPAAPARKSRQSRPALPRIPARGREEVSRRSGAAQGPWQEGQRFRLGCAREQLWLTAPGLNDKQ